VVDEGKRHGQRHPLYLRARSPGNIPERWGTRRCCIQDERRATRLLVAVM
jgi:hypothetical protein